MFDITYASSVATQVAERECTYVSVGAGYIVSVCTDVYVGIGGPEPPE